MAHVSIIVTLLALPIALIAWSAWSLAANHVQAKKAGFPILTRWVTPTNPFWMVFGSTIVRKCRALNIGTSNFWRFYHFGWEANQRHTVHQELGDVFMLVSPGGNWLCVSDSEVAYDVLRRRADFRRNFEQFAVLNVYGTNLSTTDDEEWQKHRKVTAITFTERNNELVWKESVSQATGMLQYWTKRSVQPVKTFADDTKVFTLNVLAAALFDKTYPFKGHAETQATMETQDDSFQYRDSLSKILAYIIPIFIFGARGLQSWWTPKSWKEAGNAVSVFRSYVAGLIDEERSHMSRAVRDNQHLVAALVRACEKDEQEEKSLQQAKGAAATRKMTLTKEEIISNLFVYAFAGNDTTAIALAHILVDLAAHPQIQEWIAEEIRHYLPEDDISKWNYHNFPRLKRCLAVVMESVRLNHPLGQLVKTTGKYEQPLKVGSETHIIPARTAIHLNLAALHTHPHYWGDDSLKWNPKRFITHPESLEHTLENEVLAADTSDHYLAWAWGQRVCPGKRFSQVELVAGLSALFHDHRVQPEPQKGETLQQAQARIFDIGMDIEHEGHILHEMRDPQTACLKWSRVAA